MSTRFLVVAGLVVSSAAGFAQQPVRKGMHLEEIQDKADTLHLFPRPAATGPSGSFRFGRFIGTQVNVDSSQHNILGDAANEPSIAVDPRNPKNIAIGWRQFDTVSSNFRQGGNAYSTDFGQTWHVNPVLDSDPNNAQFRSDPCLAFTKDGQFFYDSLPLIPQYNNDYTNETWPSANRGQTWTGPTFAYGGDKQWLAIDTTNGGGSGNLYEIWSDYTPRAGNTTFTRSIDGGNTYEAPVAIPTSPTFGSVAVGPDGEIYVFGEETNGNNFCLARSDSARNKLLTPVTFQFSTEVNLGGTMMFGGLNPDGILGMAWVAVAPEHSRFRGDVYALCTCGIPDSNGNYDASRIHVMFSRSSDQGQTWSTPLRVDAPSPSGPDNQAWFGTMSVAPNGRIDVVYNSTGYDTSHGANSSVTLYTYSYDDGNTWAPVSQLTPGWDPSLGYPNQNKIGDYYHMVSANNAVNLAFATTLNGEEDVYYMRIPAVLTPVKLPEGPSPMVRRPRLPGGG